MEWIPTTDKLHPNKPGLRPYEQVPCLIVRNREILLRQWNCEHLVWDTEDGDDFYCEANKDVTHWMTLPPLPPNANVYRKTCGITSQITRSNPPLSLINYTELALLKIATNTA